jgi:hypothetical protein
MKTIFDWLFVAIVLRQRCRCIVYLLEKLAPRKIAIPAVN